MNIVSPLGRAGWGPFPTQCTLIFMEGREIILLCFDFFYFVFFWCVCVWVWGWSFHVLDTIMTTRMMMMKVAVIMIIMMMMTTMMTMIIMMTMVVMMITMMIMMRIVLVMMMMMMIYHFWTSKPLATALSQILYASWRWTGPEVDSNRNGFIIRFGVGLLQA